MNYKYIPQQLIETIEDLKIKAIEELLFFAKRKVQNNNEVEHAKELIEFLNGELKRREDVMKENVDHLDNISEKW